MRTRWGLVVRVELGRVGCGEIGLVRVELGWDVSECDGTGWCGVVWCGVGVGWCGAERSGAVWCGAVRCGVVWGGVVWCGVRLGGVRCVELGWVRVGRLGYGYRVPCDRMPYRASGCLIG